MKSFKNVLTAALLAVAVPSHGQLVINEIMQSNIDCVMDDLNDFPDSWVELYNASDAVVNLQNFRLGLTGNASEAWQLPARSVGRGQRVLVYCDKVGDGIHTDFRLDSGKGGAVYLFQGDQVIDQLTGIKKQPAPNISYGRETDGASKWGYQATPTPGTANCGQVCKEALGEPVFSAPGGVTTGKIAISLTLSLPADAPAGTQIHYTTDGTEPTTMSTLYTAPIMISENKVVRAKLTCDGYLSPRSTTHSYIFFPRQLTLPVVSIVTDDKYLTDSKIGIYADVQSSDGKKNYEHNWRRPINLELFETEGKNSVINQLCETRIMGGATRGNALKSLALYANKRFGTKRFNYEFFPDQKPGLNDFKSICLRNAGNDFDYLYMRDIICQRTMASHADLDWQAWSPAIVYINGVYRGIENFRERSNEDHIYTNYDGLEDIDMFENWWELKEGTWDNYNQFKAFYNEHGHTMSEYEKWMDCQEFINLMATDVYFNNIDAPGNNIVMWRPRAEGGRWRWIAKDMDYTMKLYGQCDYNYQYLTWLGWAEYDKDHNWGANGYEGTRLFRRLMEDADFSREFIDHLAVYMGDFLNYEGVWRVWQPMYEKIKFEYPFHRKLFNEWWPNYSQEMQTAQTWLKKRNDFLYQHIADYYKLGTPRSVTVNTTLTDAERGAVDFKMNGVRLSEGKFNGKFFQNRSLTLSGTPAEGRQVEGWTVTTVAANGASSTKEYAGSTLSMTVPECSRLTITARLGDASGILQHGQKPWSWRVDGGVLSLTGVPQGERIRLYDLQGVLQGGQQGGDAQFRLIPGRTYVLRVGTEAVKIR